MKKIFLLSLITSFQLFACDNADIYKAITQEPKIDVSRFYVSLSLPEYEERLSKNLYILNYEPYNSRALLETLQILNKDSEKTQSEMQKLGVITTAKSALISGIDKLDPLFNALIWIDESDETIKLEAKQLFKNIALAGSNSYNRLIVPSYRNLLLLDAIDFFKYQEDRDKYLTTLPLGKDKKDIAYKLIYMLKNDKFIVGHNVYPQDFEFLFNEIPSKNVCSEEIELTRYKENYKYSDSVISFFAAKLFPEESLRLRNLSFLSSNNSLIWDFLEYHYQIENKDFEKAAQAMDALIAVDKDRKYLARKLSNVAYMASFNEFKKGDWLKAWRLAAISIESSKNIETLKENDIKVVTHAKQIIRESSVKLTEFLVSKNEHENADYVFNKTNDYVKILLERKF